MNDLRTAAQQVLEAMRCGVPTGRITLYAWDKALSDLDAALAQEKAEPVGAAGLLTLAHLWAQQAYFKGLGRPCDIDGARGAFEQALKAQEQAEPVQEPVAFIHRQGNHWEVSERHLDEDERDRGWTEEPLYTAPPKFVPLTDEEILKAVGWETAEMYMKLTPNFPVEEARKETLKNARAIERAHGIGGQDAQV